MSVENSATTTESSAKTETVILLGTDTPIGLAIVRDLGRHGHTTIGIGRVESALAGYSRYCKRHFVRAKSERLLIDQIKSLAAEFEASYLIAISENDLILLNGYRDELSDCLQLLIPAQENLDLVLNKMECMKHAEAVGIRTPRTWNIITFADGIDLAGSLPYPVVLKWSDPNAVIAKLTSAGIDLEKAEFVRDRRELELSLSRFQDIGIFPMIQEYCPGGGLGQMFLCKDGEVVAEFQHERIHEWPPEGGISTLCRSVPLSKHGEMRKQSRELLKRLDWTGVAMVEFRYDEKNDDYKFMEINGRFWGSLPLAIAAGVPFAAGLVSLSRSTERLPSIPKHYRIINACYFVPEAKRLFRLLFQVKRIDDPHYIPDPLKSLLIFLISPLRPSTRYYVFQFSDPLPFLTDARKILGKILRQFKNT